LCRDDWSSKASRRRCATRAVDRSNSRNGKQRPGRRGLITDPDSIGRALDGDAGTLIVPD
jgi:hypothetical protein